MAHLPGVGTLNARPVTALALAALLGPLAVPPVVRAAPHVPIAGDVALDRQVTQVLDSLVAGDVAEASVLARSLARHHPRFALGRLLHAELSATAAFDGTLVGSNRAWSPALVDLLLEARARLDVVSPGREATARSVARPTDSSASASAPAPLVLPAPPAPFVQIGRGVTHLVTVDLERSTLALHAVQGGIATRVREHYVSSGSAGFGKRREGDRKTPLGFYRIVDTHTDPALPELYGAGALVLDYPNALDRHLGRTGSGIWLHGVPRERRSRAPRSSEGCVTMSNEHLRALDARIDPARTLVVLDASSTHPDASADIDTDERARHRALFRHWRDARVRDGSAPAGLAAVNVNDVTIVHATAERGRNAPHVLVMDVAPDAADGVALTLWWTRPDGAADWTLALEEGTRSDT